MHPRISHILCSKNNNETLGKEYMHTRINYINMQKVCKRRDFMDGIYDESKRSTTLRHATCENFCLYIFRVFDGVLKCYEILKEQKYTQIFLYTIADKKKEEFITEESLSCAVPCATWNLYIIPMTLLAVNSPIFMHFYATFMQI